jgi:hypothetical protein
LAQRECFPAPLLLSIFWDFSPFTFALGRPSLYPPSANAQVETTRKKSSGGTINPRDETLCF